MAKRKLRIFDTFTLAMRNFENQDRELFSWSRNRMALSHALAMQLYKLLSEEDSSLNVDLCPGLARSSKFIEPEILVHNRETGHRVLAVLCRNDYLTEEEQSKLVELNKAFSCDLVLAVSFLPKRSYCLLYRVTDDSIEYFHFDRNTFTVDMIRSSSFDTPVNKDQLTLGIGKKKRS